MFKKRNPALVIVFSLITFGIYGLYWVVTTQNAIKTRLGIGFSGVATILLSIVTLGIYSIVWNYNLGRACSKLGGHKALNVIFLILCFTGIGSLINTVIAQYTINESIDHMEADGAA